MTRLATIAICQVIASAYKVCGRKRQEADKAITDWINHRVAAKVPVELLVGDLWTILDDTFEDA